MSLYNLMNGFNSACVILLPMLGRKPEEYPRFRDCYLSEDKERIVIYTRVGGGNRGCDMGEEELMEDPLFVKTYDDDFDCTYGSYEFNVPDKWKLDFEKIKNNDLKNVSDEYVDYCKEFYPNLAEQGVFERLYR